MHVLRRAALAAPRQSPLRAAPRAQTWLPVARLFTSENLAAAEQATQEKAPPEQASQEKTSAEQTSQAQTLSTSDSAKSATAKTSNGSSSSKTKPAAPKSSSKPANSGSKAASKGVDQDGLTGEEQERMKKAIVDSLGKYDNSKGKSTWKKPQYTKASSKTPPKTSSNSSSTKSTSPSTSSTSSEPAPLEPSSTSPSTSPSSPAPKSSPSTSSPKSTSNEALAAIANGPQYTANPQPWNPRTPGWVDVNWQEGYHGASAQPVTVAQYKALSEKIDPKDVEVKPDGVIYLPEIKYRRKLNHVFGPMGWALIPRGEPVVGSNIVTREYILVAGSRFVAQAQGENNYFSPDGLPSAVEGCKSNALMRCCKDLGIASELWDPIFVRQFKKTMLTEAWVEHAVTKKKRVLWFKKGEVEYVYPWKQA